MKKLKFLMWQKILIISILMPLLVGTGIYFAAHKTKPEPKNKYEEARVAYKAILEDDVLKENRKEIKKISKLSSKEIDNNIFSSQSLIVKASNKDFNSHNAQKVLEFNNFYY